MEHLTVVAKVNMPISYMPDTTAKREGREGRERAFGTERRGDTKRIRTGGITDATSKTQSHAIKERESMDTMLACYVQTSSSLLLGIDGF